MGQNTYAIMIVLVSLVALALLSLPATDALLGSGAVADHLQGGAGDSDRSGSNSAGTHDLVGDGQIEHPHSNPTYLNVIVAVAKYDENDRDVSDENMEMVIKALRGVGARSIEATETLSFVTASVPAERIPDISGHDLVYRVGYGEALAHPTIGKMRVTVGATADDLRRPSGMIANGSGVTVGIVDEGVNYPRGINDKVVGRISCDDLGCRYASAREVVGHDTGIWGVSHGTLVAMVLAGSGFPEHNGIAPGVSILDAGLSILYAGAGDPTISHAFSWLLREDADVANMSFGDGICRGSGIGETRQLITGGAVDNGIVVVVSAGNDGTTGGGQNRVPVYQSINQWGCAHNVITVGGINDRDPDNIQLYYDSGRGPVTHRVNSVTYPILKPEIVAPAVLQMPHYPANGTTVLIDGTSFSAPAVSAVAALVLQERDMEPAAVKTAILLGANWTGPVPCTSVQYERYNATDNCSHGRQPGSFIEGGGSLGIVNNVGFGILDAAKTLDYVSQASGRHLVEDNLDSDTNIDGYTFEVTDAENPVKIILSWTVDMFYDGYYDPRGKNYFADLGFTVDCPGMDTISAQSAYQANEFAVFTPAEAGTCTIAVMGSDIDTPRRSQQDYALASTLPLDAIDIERPGPTISSNEQSPTNSHNITFTVGFSESVDAGTFAASDVSASSGTVSDPLPANGTAEAFAFEVSDINAGNLTISIPEGGVLDPAGNNNTASDPYVIEIDRTRPAPVLSAAVSSPVNASSITFTVDFGEQVDQTTFVPSDVSASSGTVSDPLPANGTAGTFTFEVSDLAAGNLAVSIPEGGVLDLAGNNNTASDPYVAEIKRPRPSSTISTAEPSLTNAHRITFTVDFGVPVDAGTFAPLDVSTSAGTVSDPLPASGTARTFTFEVSDMAAGNLTVSIPEGGVLDPVGNSNTASDPYVIEIERIRPAPIISTAASSPVNASSVAFTVDFGEPVDQTTFTISDIFVSGGTVSNLLPADGTGMEFTFEVSGLAAGILTASIPEGGVLDPAGNNNTASNQIVLTITGIPAGTTPDAAFVTTWKTTSANEYILIPAGEATGTYTVTWGDASIDVDVSGHQAHTYKAAGTYTVSIYGDFPQIYLPYHPESPSKLQSIEQWGDIRWKSMRGAFSGAINMVYRATDAPDLSAVTDTSEMFMHAFIFNGSLSNWDVSSVTDMSQMFAIARPFNGDISGWNVSAATDMSEMLAGTSFTRNLGDWYIVLDDTTMSDANETLAISAQNAYLDGQNLTYAVDGTAPNGDKFWIVDASHLAVRANQTVVPGQYNVTIKSTGSFGEGNSKTVEITVGNDTIHHTNNPPSVDAGSGRAAGEGTTVTLAGNATDPDGDSMTYLWTHDSALDIALANAASPSATFTAPQVDSDTPVEFTLTVSDSAASASDTVTVTITDSANSPPTASAGQDQTAAEGFTVSLDGAATDSDTGDTLTYSWSHNSTLSISLDDEVLNPSFTAPNVSEETAVEFTLTVSDGAASASDTVTVTITDSANSPPTASAGQDQTAAEGSAVSLDGAATDSDTGDTLTYSWSHNSTLSISLDDEVLNPSFTAPNVSEETAVEFTLTVSDGTATVSDKVIVTVTDSANTAPSVNAGPDHEIAEGATVTLNGNATDADDDSLTYSWRQTSGLPAVDLRGANTPSPTFTAPAVASDTVFIFEMTAYDGSERSTDTVEVTIRDIPDITYFVTTWRTDAVGESITIPVGGATGTYTVDWGDGNTSVNVSGDQTHVYGDAGTYTVRISGDFTRIYLNEYPSNADKLASIEQWGDIRWESMKSAFHGAANMVYRATDVPVLSDVTSMRYMFYDAPSFDGNLSGWEVSRVTDMTGTFWGASSFDGDLSGWEVSRVTDMTGTFWGASSFDGDLSGWSVSSVTDMTSMFSGASSFDGDLSGWSVSSVTDMTSMFAGASSFDGDLSGWNVSSVTDMTSMFSGASSFDGDLSGWNVSSVTGMSNMFRGASSFDGDLSGWNVSSVAAMSAMFMDASSFDADLSDWNVSSVTDMSNMFRGASSFDGDLSSWDVSRVTDMSDMFSGADSFNADISSWNVSRVTDMYAMLNGAHSFNADISGWDVSRVTDMDAMFYQANAFDQNLGKWYIVLDNTVIEGDNATGTVGRVAAQNSFLRAQNLAYGIGSGGDSASFEMNGASLRLNSVLDGSTKNSYTVNVTSSDGFGTNNFRILEISAEANGIRSATGTDVNQTSLTGPSVPPGIPQNLRAVSTDTTVTLTWDSPDDDSITGYKILSRTPATQSQLSVLVDDTGAPGTSYVIENLDPDTIYVFRVIAVNAHGESNNSNFVRLSTDAASVPVGEPDAPQNLRAVSTNTTITLTWDSPDDDSITGYKILSRTPATQSQLSVLVDDTGAPGTSYVIENLDPDTIYVFRVIAVNAHGESNNSNFVRLSTLS